MYPLPCDEQEQDRLDIFHKVITEARVARELICSPHPRNGRFLDLGCGTGIWAIDVARKYPDAFVVAVDLAPIQPRNNPTNCDFYAPFDFESPWALGDGSWDIIHMQLGCGSVASWPSLYRRIHTHLRPGAWFEQIEIDLKPYCSNLPVERLALHHWYQGLKQATEQTMRPLALDLHVTESRLYEAGFAHVDHQTIELPLNPWILEGHKRAVARWYNLAICESIESLSLAPFTRVFGWSLDQIRQLVVDVRSEVFNKDIHAYHTLHIYKAQKAN